MEGPIIIGMIGFVLLFVLMAVGMPIGCAMGLSGFLGLAWLIGFGPAVSTLGRIPYSIASSYTWAVLPLFVLMGHCADRAGIIEDAFDVVYKWLGHLPGGLAIATTGACAGFAACTGSAAASGATMTTIAWPAMKSRGYDPELALGTIAAGGTLGILIPPSLPMVIYAVITEESVGRLFLAGVLPGILLSSLFMLTIYILCKHNPQLGPPGTKSTWAERFLVSRKLWSVALIFVVVMGGIWGGFFTPNEAAGVGAFAAFVIGLVRRRLSLGNTKDVLRGSVKTCGFLFVILIGAMIFNSFMAAARVPKVLSLSVSTLHVPPIGVVIAMLFSYSILGCLMEGASMQLLTTSIYTIILSGLGFDLVWFGVLQVVMIEMGALTPPVGLNVYVISGMVKEIPMYTIFRGIVPFVIAMIVCLAFLLAFPSIALFLPNTMKGVG